MSVMSWLLALLGIPESDVEAVKAAAETTGKAIDAARDAGGYVAATLGSTPRDLVAWSIGDRLRRARYRNHLNFLEEVQERMDRIPEDRRTPASQTVALPLLEAGTDEDRPELSQMWADLLASTMIDGGHAYRRVFRDIVGRMEPIDAVIFREAARLEKAPLPESPASRRDGLPAPESNSNRRHHLRQYAQDLGYRDDAIRISFEELQDGLLLLQQSLNFPALTTLGQALMAALEATDGL
jgi:Abortive infection alpha